MLLKVGSKINSVPELRYSSASPVSSMATTERYDYTSPRSSYDLGPITTTAQRLNTYEGSMPMARDGTTVHLTRTHAPGGTSQLGGTDQAAELNPDSKAFKDQRLRELYYRRLRRRPFLHWKRLAAGSRLHDMHLDIRHRMIWLAQKDRMLKRLVFKRWRLLNGNPAQFSETLAMISNRNDLYKRRAFGIWKKSMLVSREKETMVVHTYGNRMRARLFFWWKYVVDQSSFHNKHLAIRLQMFVNLFRRWLKKRALQEWARKICYQDPTRLTEAIEHYNTGLMRRALIGWYAIMVNNRLKDVDLTGARLYFEHLCKWKYFQIWYSFWQKMSYERLLRLVGLALAHLRRFTMMRAFAAWKSYTEASLQISRLITLSAVRSRLHHYFATWCGYVFGYQEGLGIQPGGWSMEEEMKARENVLALQTMHAVSTGRRRRALIANFKSARVLELMVQTFRSWAGMAMTAYVPPEDGRPTGDTWYPLVRLVRVVHIEWATMAGEEAWHEGLKNAQRVWHAFQVWKMFLFQQRLQRQRDLLMASRWYTSRLAWRSYQAWIQVVLAARVANNIHEQARLWMFLAFERWRNTACVSHSKITKAIRMRVRGLKRIKMAFFNTWRRTTERSNIGRHMRLLIGEVEVSARAAREENEAMRRGYEDMLHQTAASEEEARQEREVAKRLCAEQMNTAELYHELLQKAQNEAELQRRRGEAAEQEARDAQERANRLASAVEEETKSYNSLVTNLTRLREESSSCRATLSQPQPKQRTECPPAGGLCCSGPCGVVRGKSYQSVSPYSSPQGFSPHTPSLAPPPPLSLSPSVHEVSNSYERYSSVQERYAAAGAPPPRRRAPVCVASVDSPPREVSTPPARPPSQLGTSNKVATYAADLCSELASMLPISPPLGPVDHISMRSSPPEAQIQPCYGAGDLTTEHEVDLWVHGAPALMAARHMMGR